MNFIKYLYGQLGSIYLWGAQGENILAKANPLEYIRDKESQGSSSAETNEKNAQRVYALFLKRKSEGVNPIRAYDCSGLIVKFLLDNKVIDGDRNAQMLYNMCDIKLERPEKPGDFCCKYDAEKKRITHIGVYVGDGQAIEAFGRDVGVIKTDVDKRPWNRFGRLSALEQYLNDYSDVPLPLDVRKPALSGNAYAAMQEALDMMGYKDDSGEYLVVDGKWGKKSQQAWNNAVRQNLGAVTVQSTVTIEGIGEY